ncbi:MAG: alpha/beta hydrolase [Candidatus Amulumruptor caecigallinarius]|nr:alpha/beta hydrolase [Candidatus Amulumruptor caecigallinarius]MCM1396360.1 alpha/beta hydrolase [Candidatus Amulumruptor caecigallinarius]MCM1453698.1 alpha/beta hydrolase [bacterium]
MLTVRTHSPFRVIISLIVTLASVFPAMRAQQGFNIWEGTDCDARVTLTPYLAEGSGNTAVIVCPGGSYFWLDRSTEGKGVAEWLRSEGVSAFVLEYRVAGIPAFITHYRLFARGNRYPDMLCDLLRAIALLRERAGEFGIAPERVGVMGFSAGGHLAALAGIQFDAGLLDASGGSLSQSLKPAFVASIYPVVSLTEECTHKRSRRGLLGEGHSISEAMKDSLSLERHVRPDMPPLYLMNCVDDPVVDFRNSVLLDSALTAADVPHRYRQYATGGHGFGANPAKTTSEAIAWKADFITWLRHIGALPAKIDHPEAALL